MGARDEDEEGRGETATTSQPMLCACVCECVSVYVCAKPVVCLTVSLWKLPVFIWVGCDKHYCVCCHVVGPNS